MTSSGPGISPQGSHATLEVLDPKQPPVFAAPTKCIHQGSDVARFLTSRAYRDIGTFVLQLNHAMVPRRRPERPSNPLTFTLDQKASTSPRIVALQSLLSSIEALIEQAPPDPGPRRFGNVSFRKWHACLEESASTLLKDGPLGEVVRSWGDEAGEEVKSYLLGSFGSAQRLDYGTGHELSFVAFLGCLWKLGFFVDDEQGGTVEREIVLHVFEPYLKVVRKLILTYTLEPAGSHGVWGLDDHSFIPYIFGSAQLARPIAEGDPTPLEGSVFGAPKPSQVTSAQKVQDYRESNMYFSAIGFISDVKKGPFWEHSPILFDISGIRDGWGKINKGMVKMFNAEVLSKFPVVQHFHFGSLFSWEQDPSISKQAPTVHMAQHATMMAPPAPSSGTAAGASIIGNREGPLEVSGIETRIPPTTLGRTAAPMRSTQRPLNTHGAGDRASGADMAPTKAPWAT